MLSTSRNGRTYFDSKTMEEIRMVAEECGGDGDDDDNCQQQKQQKQQKQQGRNPQHTSNNNNKITTMTEQARKEALEDIKCFDARFKIDKSTCDNVNQLYWNHVHRINKVLGEGSFCRVVEATFRPVVGIANLVPGRPYAVKCLREEMLHSSKASLVHGAVDLATEAQTLSQLQNENIIRLYGVYGGPLSESYANLDSWGYFLVLEPLHETLQHRLDQLRFSQRTTRRKSRRASLSGLFRTSSSLSSFSNKSSSSSAGNSSSMPSPTSKRQVMQRVWAIAPGVARGMSYLHRQNIMLRDLKPENIGFDANGVVKLFDFGLARKVDDDYDEENVAGTVRYMAPEHHRGLGSGLPSDVYSFGIVLWELCTLQHPYEGLSLHQFQDTVVNGDVRPPLSGIPFKPLRQMAEFCWDKHPKMRPTFSRISVWLQETFAAEQKYLQFDHYNNKQQQQQQHKQSSSAIPSLLRSTSFVLRQKAKRLSMRQASVDSGTTTQTSKLSSTEFISSDDYEDQLSAHLIKNNNTIV